MTTNLTINPSAQNAEAKTQISSISCERNFTRKRNAKTYMQVWIKHNDPDKDSVLAMYASRHLDSYDDRMVEYRKQFSAIVKHFHLNELLDFEPTQEQLENPKGFRWSQKAYCSCGCSPAFSVPSWLVLKNRSNEISVSLEVKPQSELKIVYNQSRLEAIKDHPLVLEDEAKNSLQYDI